MRSADLGGHQKSERRSKPRYSEKELLAHMIIICFQDEEEKDPGPSGQK